MTVCVGSRSRSADCGACCGACQGRGAVLLALRSADVTPAAAVGDSAELLDVDVDQVAGALMLVASDRLSGRPVEVAEPVEPAADQDRVHGRGLHAEPVGD